MLLMRYAEGCNRASMADKITQFSITFERNGQVRSGEYLNGYVTLNVAKQVKIKGIQLTFYGGATLSWTETTPATDEQESTSTTYSNAETFFNTTVELPVTGVPSKKSGNTWLSPNRYTYPFSYQIPLNVPSTFSGSNGSVVYNAFAKCIIPWGKDKKTGAARFEVKAIRDLNLIDYARLPQELHEEKTLCCLCCQSGPIEISMKLERAGYVPGDMIPYKATVVNGSNRRLPGARISLMRNETYTASNGRQNKHSAIVASEKKSAIEPGETCEWNQEFRLHSDAQPTDAPGVGCRIIDITYTIEFIVTMPSFTKGDVTQVLGIVVGTVPLLPVICNQPGQQPSAPPYIPPTMNTGIASTEKGYSGTGNQQMQPTDAYHANMPAGGQAYHSYYLPQSNPAGYQTQPGALTQFGVPNMPPGATAQFGTPNMPPGATAQFGPPNVPPGATAQFGNPNMPPGATAQFGNPNMPPGATAQFGTPNMPPGATTQFGAHDQPPPYEEKPGDSARHSLSAEYPQGPSEEKIPLQPQESEERASPSDVNEKTPLSADDGESKL